MDTDLPYSPVLPGSLNESRQWSDAALTRLRASLRQHAADLVGVYCIGAAGSLGRGEAGPASDVDCLVVTHTTAEPTDGVIETVVRCMEEVGLQAPKAGGFFRRTVPLSLLTAPERLGRVDEDPATYGKRLQVLLESRPLLHEEAHGQLQRAVLDWFTRWQPVGAPLALLASELVRYRRSYCSYQYYQLDPPPADDGRTADDSWHLRYAKLGSCRLVAIAGLLALVGAASVRQEPVAWVARHLDLCPLDRLLMVVRECGPPMAATADAIAGAYAVAHRYIESPERRDELISHRVQSLAELEGGAPAPVPELSAALRALSSEINAFFLAQQGAWAPWFAGAVLL